MLVDASIVVQWALAEEGSEIAQRLLGRTDLLAPELIVIEGTNALWAVQRHGFLDADKLITAVRGLPSVFRRLFPSAPYAARATEIAIALDHPIYNCVYLAAAEEWRTPLVTADRRLLARLRGTDYVSLAQSLADATGGAPS